jgi:hypothetical protein
VLAAVAVLGALDTVEIDRRLIEHEDVRGNFLHFGAGAGGARGVRSVIMDLTEIRAAADCSLRRVRE